MSLNVKGNHPLAEIIAKCLFGIEQVPKKYMGRMVNRACKKAVEYHKKEIKKLTTRRSCSCYDNSY